MPKQQLEIPDPLDIEAFFLDEAATIEERAIFWEEYYQLMDEEKREFERSINIITIPISEGLCQSNNLNHLFTVM